MAKGTPRDRRVHAGDPGHGSDRQQYRRRAVLPGLLSQIAADERISSVSDDGAYDTKDCREAIALRAAHAIIPTRKNAKPWKTNRCGADARNEILHTTRRLGRAIWKRWSGYHRRSLVETKMRCFKLLGERVMARDFDRQVAELQVRAAVLNHFTRLGRPVTVPVLQNKLQIASARPPLDLLNKAIRNPTILDDNQTANIGWDLTRPENKGKPEKELHDRDKGRVFKTTSEE
jgi:hypothetical protein